MARTVGDRIVERLLAWGVDTVFGLPGDGVNGIFEAMRTHRERLRFIQVRHEEAAAFAAVGYAKYTGRLGVCIATSGPGGIHLLNGLYDAKCDGQPVLAITGHTFHDLIGTHFQQDVDLDKVFMDVAVYNQRLMGPSHVENLIDEAIKTALSRRGVAHLTVPKDIQDWAGEGRRAADNVPGHSGIVYSPATPEPTEEQLQSAAAILNAGRKVAILAGRGALGAREELLQLADRLAAPIVKPLLGKATVPDDSPFTTGGIGLLGTAPSQEAIAECDTLLLLGTSFPYLEFYPKPGSVRAVQVDVDPARLGLRFPVELGIVGDCRKTLRALLPMLRRQEDRDFLETCQGHMRHWNELMRLRATRDDVPMKPQVVARALSEALADDAIVSADSGTIATWAARHVWIRGEMQFSLSGTLASMANGLPYSIGAAVAYPGRQVVCLVGDGGFTMLMGEVATLVKYQLPVKVIVFKNNVLGMIKWEQMVFEGNPQYGVELQPIDFGAFARACGAAGFRLERPSDAAAVMREALAAPGPAVVEAVVDPLEPPLPGNVTMKQARKFMESLVRGEPERWDILKGVLREKVREIV